MRSSSLDLPGGSVDTAGGEILIRTEGQAYWGEQFETLPLLTRPDGSRLLLGDVARVVDGFADTDQSARFDGEPAVLVKVFRVGDQDALAVAGTVKDYVARKQKELPEGIDLTLWQDDTKILKSRRDLLVRNGFMGFLLVFLVLALFLRLRLAGWVALGIPVSFLGGLWLMPTLGVTVNMLSLFAFIVVLGIVVDDAIVVGENIYTHYQRGESGLRAAVPGVQEVAMPVVFAVLTTVAAFSPLLSVPGNMGKFMRVIPLIVIPVLLFSLAESLLILPAHLSHLSHVKDQRRLSRVNRAWRGFQDTFGGWLDRFIHRTYDPSLEWALRWRYLALALGVAMLLVVGGLVAGGWIQFTFLPAVEADNVVAILEMPRGTPVERTTAAVRKLEDAAREVQAELERQEGAPVFEHVLASVGEQPFRTQQSQGHGGVGETYSGGAPGRGQRPARRRRDRAVKSQRIADLWRERTGPIADAVQLTFTASLFSVGDAINIQLTGEDLDELQQAAARVKDELRRYAGVTDIGDSFRAGKQEVELELTDEARGHGPDPGRPRRPGALRLLRRRGPAHPARQRGGQGDGALPGGGAPQPGGPRAPAHPRHRARTASASSCPSPPPPAPSSAAASPRSTGSTGGGRSTSPRTWTRTSPTPTRCWPRWRRPACRGRSATCPASPGASRASRRSSARAWAASPAASSSPCW